MSGFASAANAFLSSRFAEKTSGPNASTARGAGIHLNCHPTLPLIIYPSGKYIVVKNLEDPSSCFIYRGHAHPTTVAKFSPNGFWVASADSAGKVRVWSWDNPEHTMKLETQVFAGPVLDLDWDMEAKKIVAAGEGSGMMVKCFLWDTGNSVGEMVGHNKKILSVAYKPSRPFRIMTGSEDMRTLFYAGPPFKLDHSNAPHTNFVNCVRYSTDGTKIVSVGSDKKIQFYDGATGEPSGEIMDAHTGSIYSASFSPDGTQLVTASADKTVKLWNVGTATLEKTFTFGTDPQIGDMQVSVLWMSTGHLVSVSLNGNINILDQNTPTCPRQVLQAHQVAITSMCLDAATMTVYTGSFDGMQTHNLIVVILSFRCTNPTLTFSFTYPVIILPSLSPNFPSLTLSDPPPLLLPPPPQVDVVTGCMFVLYPPSLTLSDSMLSSLKQGVVCAHHIPADGRINSTRMVGSDKKLIR